MTCAERFAVWFVARISTLTTVGVFMLVPLVGMASSQTTRETIQFLSSSWAQLWFLPLIMLGQTVQGRMADAHREKIEAAAIARHEAREKRAARHHDDLILRLEATVKHVEHLCECIAAQQNTTEG